MARIVAWVVVVWSLFALTTGTALAQPTTDTCSPGDACPFDAAEPQGASTRTVSGTLLFFWGVGCPHCEEAKPFMTALAKEYSQLRIESIEVRKSEEGRRRFVQKIRELEIKNPGIPAFIFRNHFEIGFRSGHTERRVRAMVQGQRTSGSESVNTIDLPLLGLVHTADYSLPALTLTIGLLDGINPCAMWVLLVLLGIMTHTRSRARMALVGALFVFMSGLVYFLFMTLWVGLFQYAGLSRGVTLALGIAVLGMGIVNLKELVWFKRGPSLTIPDRLKPELYRRMRRVANAASLPAAITGIALLAFLVNLVELGCTLGLPAVYSRVLSMRVELSQFARYAYLALYNAAYVVPLAVIVLIYTVTLHRLALTERGAKVLKGISGVLLVGFGVVFLVKPELLA